MVLRETLERREVEFEKQASELRVQVIDLRESNVSNHFCPNDIIFIW